MGLYKYSHAFTKMQLELIIDDYLGLGPYFKVLQKQLKKFIKQMEEDKINIHRSEKAHPIRIYTKDYLSKNFQDGDLGEIHFAFQSPKCDIRTTYSSVVAKYYYIYPLEVVIKILQSESFYKQLPKDIIINQLLTTENIQIMIQTLSIVSEQMSKKIKSTLSSKDVRRTKKMINDKQQIKKQDDDFFQMVLPTIKQQSFERENAQSKIDILFDDEQVASRKKQKKRTFYNPLIRTQVPGNIIESKQVDNQRQCIFCQNYLIYLIQNYGENYDDDSLNKLTKQAIKYLKIISQTVIHFTLYMIENNITQIPNQIHTLNRVLNNIGIVITEDIFNSQLNPKNKKSNYNIIINKPKNLIEHLIPYFSSSQQIDKQRNKGIYTIDQLLRMVIYCPTVQQVAQQLKNYQIETFQKQNIILKCGQNEQKFKHLLKKQFDYIKDYENQRLQISKNTINTKPIYKQLQFQQEKIISPSVQPQNYNVNSFIPTSRVKSPNSSRHPFIDKNQTVGQTVQPTPSPHKKQNKSLLIELTNSISHNFKTQNSHDQSEGCSKTNKGKFKKQSISKVEKGINSMTNSFKKNLIKNGYTPQLKNNPSIQKLNLIRPPSLQKQSDFDLSQSDFKKLLYNAFVKTQGFKSGDTSVTFNIPSMNYTAPTSFGNFLNTGPIKNKKNNGYSSSLNQFIGRKQQQQQIECMQKLQKQTYNKQLLNGQFIRNQIYQQINLGIVKIYQNYNNACGLIDTIKIQQLLISQPTQKITNSDSSRKMLQKSCSRGKSNVIQQNSTKYNQTGIIRNEKYNKSIKNQLINHRQSYLRCNQNQNLSKMHLALTNKLKKVSSKQNVKSIKQRYEEELRIHLSKKNQQQQNKSDFSEFNQN